jgi:lycopene beta-cyclase
VDKEPKNKNDRTWCFWETGTGFFESIVCKKWESLWFHGDDFSKKLHILPYRYKMIRGIDFYDHCLSIIQQQKNISIRYGTVHDMGNDGNTAWLMLDNEKLSAGYIFNSILFSKPAPARKEFYLLQHFKGWLIETEHPVFDDREATLMDFRVDQQKGTCFVYLMPLDPSRALVEYTLFSKELLPAPGYDAGLKSYINDFLPGISYRVTEEEFGVIPMTNHAFPRNNGRIIQLGTAGGQTKASSGYTFRFIQKHSEAIVKQLADGKENLRLPRASAKYHFYDSVLLNVLATGKLPGHQVFTRLFSKNNPQDIFQFLDNESSLSQEIKLISSLPTLPFLKAGMQQLF